MARLTMKNDNTSPLSPERSIEYIDVERIVEIPIDRIIEVERIIERPVEVLVERMVLDNTKLDDVLSRLNTLENQPREITNIIEKTCTCEAYSDSAIQKRINDLEETLVAMRRGNELMIKQMNRKPDRELVNGSIFISVFISIVFSLFLRYI